MTYIWERAEKGLENAARRRIAVSIAATTLRLAGHSVRPSADIPGLWVIDDREVTGNQLLDIASQAAQSNG